MFCSPPDFHQTAIDSSVQWLEDSAQATSVPKSAVNYIRRKTFKKHHHNLFKVDQLYEKRFYTLIPESVTAL
jgi:hypothetical protein